MIIKKYNTNRGSTASSGTSTIITGGGASVDLTPITEKISALETRCAILERYVSSLQSAMSQLGDKYLSKNGDVSEGSYTLGAVYTNFLQSRGFDNGIGVRLSGDDASAVDNKYNFIVKDLGVGQVNWATIESTPVIVDTPTTSGTDTFEATYTLTNIAHDGYLIFDCGYELTHSHCFNASIESVKYDITTEVGMAIYNNRNMEAYDESTGRYIVRITACDSATIKVKVKFAYAFSVVGDTTTGTYRIYVRGTDAVNETTDCFAGALKQTTTNASGVVVMNGTTGIKLAADGIYSTTDGGNTWTSV